MLTVVGGTYREYCDEPHWEELYGSGLRAAVAVSARVPVRLITFCDVDTRPDLEIYAASANIELSVHDISQTLRFAYSHPLARPEIQPDLSLVTRAAPISITAPSILRFGMLDGDAIVHGDRVVYDPQSAFQPTSFAANGSTAASLAIVANVRELLALAGEQALVNGLRTDTMLRNAADRLLTSGASVVVAKRGARGATVYTSDAPLGAPVPAFYAKSVWPVGSGDVFAAIFAEQWAIQGRDPIAAATHASAAVAQYCASRVLPVDADLVLATPSSKHSLPVDEETTARRVYLAGPFFSMAERWLVRESRDALHGHGLSVFSPFHDVGIGPAADVVPHDIAELERCDVMLALVDGADPGTLFEIGYARKRGMPVVVFVQRETPEALKMLVGSGCQIHDDFASAVYHVAWTANDVVPPPGAPAALLYR